MVPEKVIESLLFSVLGCSDPLFSTVRRLLPASSSSAKDLRCAAWISLPCNCRLPLRVTTQKNGQLITKLFVEQSLASLGSVKYPYLLGAQN